MAFYKILIKRSAEKELRKISSSELSRVMQKIEALADHPRPSGVQMLKGEDQCFRLRQGNYRIIYEVDDIKREIMVIKVGHRREVYR